MKKVIHLLIAIVLSAQLHAQLVPTIRENQLSKKQQAIQQAVILLFDALTNRDSISLKNSCTADVTLYEYGQVWNIDTLILKAITLNQSTDFKRTNSFEFITTAVNKTTAWITYRLQSEIFKDGKQATVQWLETVVLVKQKKHWKVKHLHSTLIKRT
jgi:SnoaL-like domain